MNSMNSMNIRVCTEMEVVLDPLPVVYVKYAYNMLLVLVLLVRDFMEIPVLLM